MKPRGIGLALLLAYVPACAEYDTHVVTGPARPAPGATVTVDHQKKAGAPKTHVQLAGSTIEVTASEPRVCRDVRTRAAVADQTTEHNLTSRGKAVQWVTGGLALLSDGLGAVYIAGPCTKEVTTNSGATSGTRPCTADEAKSKRATGYGMLALGVGFSIPFVVNVIRGTDTTETVPTDPVTESSGWKDCGKVDLEDATVDVAFGDGTVRHAKLDENGQAKLDLADLQPTPGMFANPKVEVKLLGHTIGTMQLDQLPQYAQWKKEAARKQENAQCEGWFNAEQASAFLAEGVREPPDIDRASNNADARCAGSRAEDCTEKAGEKYCSQRAALIARGGNPNSPSLRADEVKRFQAAQTITPAEAKKLLPVGQTAVWQQLKAPSTASLVAQQPMFRCPGGDLVAEYTFDAQNSFGAMLRGRACAFILANGTNASVIDCVTADLAPLAIPKGDIDALQHACIMYHSLLK